MKMKRFLALILSLCTSLSLTMPNMYTAFAAENGKDVFDSQALHIKELDGSDYDIDLTKDGVDSSDLALDEEVIDPEEAVRVIIVMEGDSIIEEDSSAVMDSETEAKAESLEENQAAVVAEIEETVFDGESLEISHSYTWLLNGVDAVVPYGTIAQIEAIKGVKQVLLQPVYTVCEDEVDAIAYPMTVSDGVMIGRESTWAEGYTGQGIKIAIIDTGLDKDHQNFAALSEDKLTEDSATRDTVAAVLDSLNASRLYSGLTVDDVYYSSKVAFGFNYYNGNTDITHKNDTQGDHGTHVAGIAAANKVEGSDVVGVAPDAQLYIMKVFGWNAQGASGASAGAILAALEDAMMLGADVINMSLGSAAGFTSDGEEIDAIYGRVSETGTILAISAGNNATMGTGNVWGLDENLVSNPDNGIVGSPGTYTNALTVASMENAYFMSEYVAVNDYNIGYSDSSYGSNRPMSSLAGQSFEIVQVPGVGDTADYEGLDVTGKIALVQRGVISFTDKCQNAEAAGAVACLVYNNTGGTINMDLTGCTATIPCASITLADGAYIIAALEEDAAAEMTIGEGETLVASSTANQMSSFSSWGPAPDLSLEPDITAPGGNIYSTLDGGTYGLMSGTSMASPNVAGLSALVLQYIRETYGLSGTELHNMVGALLMSTSIPVNYDDELYYSPRLEGSGLANAYNAVSSQAYLSVEGSDVPKSELGDDPGRTGSYSYSFDVNNFGGKDLFYDLDTIAQTEDVDDTYADYGMFFMSSTPRGLDATTGEDSASMVFTHDVDDNGETWSHDAYLIYQAAVAGNPADKDWADVSFRYNLDGNETVDEADVQAYLDALVGNESPADLADTVLKVSAGGTATVTVDVTLADTDKDYFDTYYENGCYVEGFTFLTALNAGGVDLSLPYLAFYGGWDEAPAIDTGFYWEDEMESFYSQYANVLWTQFDQASNWLPGLNPYVEEDFDVSHISLSPNGDLFADYIDDIYVSLLRNAADLSFTYTDAETGEVYFEESIENVPKSYYIDEYGTCIPYIYSWYSYPYDLTDENGEVLPNNTKLLLDIAATIDYEGAAPDVWEVPITVDTQAPDLLEAAILHDLTTDEYYAELTFRDNVSVAAVNFLSSSGTVIYGQYAADDAESTIDENGNRVWTARYNITGLGDHFMVVLGDYALNEGFYSLTAEGNPIAVDDTLFYGYRVADDEINNDTLYGWIGIEVAEDEDGVSVNADAVTSEYYMDYALTAAEQVGGYVIAVDANNDLVWIQPGYWDERHLIKSLDVGIRELTYDPVTETLYGLTGGSSAYLVTIDPFTGELSYVSNTSLSGALALASDESGNLYGIYCPYGYAQFRAIDKETGAWGETLLNGSADGMPIAYYAQSMTCSDGVFYWAQYNYYGQGDLYAIAQDDEGAWSAVDLGTIAGNAEVVGLLRVDTNELTWPDSELEALEITPATASLLVGGSTTLSVIKDPWFSDAKVTWSSDNEAVAVVDGSGRVTATGVGTAVITAASGDVTASALIHVVAPDSEMNAFAIASMSELDNQWINLSADDPAVYEVLTDSDTVTFTAAEYVNGTVYAYDEVCSFYYVDPTDYSYKKIASAVAEGYQIIDMAYDYTTGYLYGLATNYSETSLVAIDPLTGSFQFIDSLMDSYYNTAVGIAVDNEGLIYYICSGYGFLYTYDPATYESTVIGLTGYAPVSYIQSMAFDHDTEELYWAAVTGTSMGIMYVDTDTGVALDLGAVDGGAQISGLYIAPENPPETPEVAVEEVYLTSDSVTLLEGGSMIAPVEVLPYNATDRVVTWKVEDESVAVIKDGTITGVSVGTTTATGTVAGFTVTLEINVIESAGAFRGYVLSDFLYGTYGYWCELYDNNIQTPGQESFLFTSDYDVYAADYYDGYIYCYAEDPSSDFETLDTAMHFLKVDAETGEIVADYTGYDYFTSITDMAFDYSEGAMYAIANPKNSTSDSTLYTFDLKTGKLYAVAALDDYLCGLACSADGQLYTVNSEGTLYKLDKVTGELEYVGDTGYAASGYQSMAFDHDTGLLHWAWCYSSWDEWSGMVTEGALLRVDTADASTMNLGKTNAMLSGLYFPAEEEPVVPDEVSVSKLVLSSTSLLMEAGDSEQLTAMLLPVSVRDVTGEVTFTSSDPDVATVSEDGLVTAVGPGAALITAVCGEISAVCTVNVVDEHTRLVGVNAGGWESTALMDPSQVLDTAELDASLGLTMAYATYNTEDGCIYAVDTEGCLWKVAGDMTAAEKVDETSLVEQMEDVYGITPRIRGLSYNAFDGGLYILVGDYDAAYDYYMDFYIFSVDTETGSVGDDSVTVIDSYTLVRPAGLTFNSAGTALVYDIFNDYLYQVNLNSFYETPKSVLWAQQSLVADENCFSIFFSKELNRLFIVTSDSFYGTGVPSLYIFNPETGLFGKVADGAWTKDIIGLFLIEE